MTTRGRVVMLVDNDVRGDSRVQKEARSMAAAGWEVILLGERRDAPLETWTIGEAQVRLVPMDNKLTYAPSTWRAQLVAPAVRLPAGPGDRVQAGAGQGPPGRHGHPARRPGRQAPGRRLGGGRRGRQGRPVRAAGDQQGAEPVDPVPGPRGAPAARGTPGRQRAAQPGAGPVLAGDHGRPRVAQAGPVAVAMGVRVPQRDRRAEAGHHPRQRLPDAGVGARAKIRASAEGRPVKLVWDAHEYAPGLVPRANPRWLPAVTAHEAEFVPYADAVVTVSPSLATLLQQEHGLAASRTW